MSWIDERLQDLGNSAAISGAYDSLVRKLPVADETKEKVVSGGHTVGGAMVTGLRKTAQVAEGAIKAGIRSAKEPLPAADAAQQEAPDEVPASGEFLTAIERLAALRADGAITHEEFEAAKRKLFDGEE